MANQTMMQKLEQEKTRLKAAVGELVARSEPINIIHMLQFSIMALRCEFTVMMAMLAEKRSMEEQEYFKRVIDHFMFEIKQLEKFLGVTVDANGRIHKLEKPKLLRPGSSGPLN